MSVTADQFRYLMQRWSSGVSVVTARNAAGALEGCTVSALVSVSVDPPLLLISLNKASRTLAAVRATRRFCTSILRSGQEGIARDFAVSGLERDFSALSIDVGGLPAVPDALGHVICEQVEETSVADHVLVVGRPLEASANSGRPLVYFERGYHPL